MCGTEAHSSIEATAKVMDAEIVRVGSDECGRIIVSEARQLMKLKDGIFAIVANAGATNSGAVDDISGLADIAQEFGAWLRVDGA